MVCALSTPGCVAIVIEVGRLMERAHERTRRLIITTVAMACLGCQPVTEDRPVISIRQTCQDCELKLVAAGRLRSTRDPSDPGAGYPNAIIRSEAGVYYLASPYTKEPVQVYDSSGSFQRSIGRTGDGPDEFRNVRSLALRGDTLLVMDSELGKLARYSRGEQLVDETTVPVGMESFTTTQDGRLIVGGLNDGMETLQPFHILDRMGQVIGDFGGSERPYDRAKAQLFRWPMSASHWSTIWTAERTAYRIIEWDQAGNMLRRFERDVDWFKPHENTPQFRPGVRPGPTITAVRQDRDGFIWVAISVADEDWDHPSMYGSVESGQPFLGDVNRYFDSIVEVIDTREGIVLLHGRFDDHIVGFPDDTRIASFGYDDDDEPEIDIWVAARS